MWLLHYPAVLILLIAVSIATPPPGYVEPINDDKNPPRYEYKYEIVDAQDKGSQGKAETRSGELASGRYYVNDEKSSTDVKYYADEWGYHPLVKYRVANDHSVATSHFASGEHAVKSGLNGSEVVEGTKLTDLKGRRDHRRLLRLHRPTQLAQPYQPSTGEITKGSNEETVNSSADIGYKSKDVNSDVILSANHNDQQTLAQDSNLRQATASTRFQQNFHNYVTPPRAESIEQTVSSGINAGHYHRRGRPLFVVKTTPIPDQSSPASIYVSHSSTTNPFSSAKPANQTESHQQSQENINDLYSTLSDDSLVVENAGSFGRRIKPNLSVHQHVTDSKRHREIISSTYQALYESSTPASRIFKVTPFSHEVSSYVSYPTNVPTTRPNDRSISNDVERHLAQTSDIQDIKDSIRPKVSSGENRYSINGAGHSEKFDAYAAIFAKIFPNAVRDHEVGESVNSLTASNLQSKRQEHDANDTIVMDEAERMDKPRLLNYDKEVDHRLYVTLRQSLNSELRELSNPRTSTPGTTSAYSSKPIIVAELSSNENDGGIEYSTTAPCQDEVTSSTMPSVTSTYTSVFEGDKAAMLLSPKSQVYQGPATTASVILNLIQAGVQLVNADQTELIGSANREVRLPAPVTERIEGESQVLARNNSPSGSANELGKIVAEETRSEFYETINPAFGQSTYGNEASSESMAITEAASSSAGDTASMDANAKDRPIEIQEIYANPLVQEMRYLSEAIKQISGVNSMRNQVMKQQVDNITELMHQRDRAQKLTGSYVELKDPGNAKQVYSLAQAQRAEEETTRGAQLSLKSDRDSSSLIRQSVYHGSLVRQDNELTDYPLERNNGLPTLLPGITDAPRIIQLTRNLLPELKYAMTKTPRINVKGYPMAIQTNDDGQSKGWQQDDESLSQRHENPRSKVTEQLKKVVSPLKKILSESESAQGYSNGDERSNFETAKQITQQQSRGQQEEHQTYRVQENVDESGSRQTQQQQSMTLPWSELYDSKDNLGVLNNGVQSNSNMSEALQVSRSKAGERIVEKTVHVPSPYPVEVPRIIEKKVLYPVEKIVEKKVPFPVEKIVERKIPVPQPYPVHIQVPVDRVVEKQVQILQPYPVHIEKIIEKKVPYPVQKLVPQPYPVHILQPYPVEKIIEKPVHIPITVEKIVEKKVHVPQPYPVQVPVKLPYPVEIMKYVENTVHVPYGVRYGVSYQQIMKPESSKGLYGGHSTVSVPLYGVSLISNHNRERQRPNATQDFQGYSYEKPAIPFISGASINIDHQRSNGWENFSHDKSTGLDNVQRHQAFNKKAQHGYTSNLPSFTYPIYNYSGVNRRHAFYRSSDGTESSVLKDEYVGPVPALKQNAQHKIVRSRSSVDQQPQQLAYKQQHSTAVTRASSSPTSATSARRARQPDNSAHYQAGSGAFRQSRIEYGFKPPMVPSVQYDENTATKVEN